MHNYRAVGYLQGIGGTIAPLDHPQNLNSYIPLWPYKEPKKEKALF